MSESASSYQIEHLKSPNNYPTWSVQLKDILTEANLSGYANRTIIHLILDADGKNKDKLTKWDTKDAKALTVIRTRITQAMMTYVISASTAHEAWISLQSVFDIQGPITTILEYRCFYWYNIPNHANLKEHVRTLHNIKEHLTFIKEPITEKVFNLNLLASLPESWDPFISVIDLTTLTSNLSTLIG